LPRLERLRYAGEELLLVHGVDQAGRPDWLGEIFEWLSSSLELGISGRDSAGRIPYSETVFARQAISPLEPHAALLMAWLENALENGGRQEALPKAPSPVARAEHVVVCSHDIDFHFSCRSSALRRLGKNLGISVTQYRSPSFFGSSCRMMLGLLLRERPGEYVGPLLRAIEERGFRSTLFAVADGGHRRDPSYRLHQIAPQLREAASRGFPVGVHASYASVVENDSLLRETALLTETLGRRPLGNRQHWLRFDCHAKLFRAVERAGFLYDSSLGFAEVSGFRNGANFAFPPYDFENERPCAFLEIPLVIMDGSLAASARRFHREPQAVAEEILQKSRKWGWGGMGILWHNPMEAIQVPPEINRVFWECAAARGRYAEQWMSADQFLGAALGRYHAAGLLAEVRLDA